MTEGNVSRFFNTKYKFQKGFTENPKDKGCECVTINRQGRCGYSYALSM